MNENDKQDEPVAWMDEFGNVFPLGAQRGPKYLNESMKPLYTHTAQPVQPAGAQGEPAAWVDPVALGSVNKDYDRGFSDAVAECKRLNHPAPAVAVNQQMIKAAKRVLETMNKIANDAMNRAKPVCCGRTGHECCGCPEPEWDKSDMQILDDIHSVYSEFQTAIKQPLAAEPEPNTGQIDPEVMQVIQENWSELTAEQPPLVRLTDEEIDAAFSEADKNCMNDRRFAVHYANAIMDAMERMNK